MSQVTERFIDVSNNIITGKAQSKQGGISSTMEKVCVCVRHDDISLISDGTASGRCAS